MITLICNNHCLNKCDSLTDLHIIVRSRSMHEIVMVHLDACNKVSSKMNLKSLRKCKEI